MESGGKLLTDLGELVRGLDSLAILHAGSPDLLTPSTDIPRELLSAGEFLIVAERMRALMIEHRGVGLAANQIGVGLRMIVIEDRAQPSARTSASELLARSRVPVSFYALLNPVIAHTGTATAAWFEGCLSVPGYSGVVERPTELRVVGWDVMEHKERTFTAKGWHARIVAHEVDHLDGRLYVECMRPRSFSTKQSVAAAYRGLGEAELSALFPA